MRVLIMTYGSRGDVQPYIALGKGLKEAGHDVAVATSERFRDFVGEHGLHYGYMNDRMLSLLDTDQGRDLIENTNGLFQVVRQTFSMMKQVGPMQQALMEESGKVADDFRPDLIVFHPKAYGGPHFAEKLGVPVVLATPIPMFVPTAESPNMGFPNLRLGAWYNRSTYRVVNLLMRVSAGKYVRQWREEHGLPRQKRFDLLHTTDGRPIPVLNAVSRHVMPQPADWPETAVMTGYWFIDSAGDWSPPTELTAFLKTGPPPVYIGFGSMVGRNPERLTRVAVDALKTAGTRGIIATGWGGLDPDQLPDSIIRIDQAPHDWLFPQVAAVVHHGGAGTTAASLRVGKPSVVVPFFGDQPFWGRRLHQLGAASRPIPQKKLTAQNLAAAIQEVTGNERIVAAAEELGRNIRNENGIQQAVTLLESFASQQQPK